MFPYFNKQNTLRLLQNPLCIILLGVVLLGVTSFLNVPIGNDEGGWGYIGRAFANGELLPYSGIADNKTPGIFYLNALSYTLFGANVWFPRLLALIATVLTALFIYRALKHAVNKRTALFSMTAFLLLMPLPAVDGSYAQTETFMNLFVIVSFYFLVVGRTWKKYTLAVLLSGLFLGFAVAFRQSAIVSVFPLLVFLAFFVGYDQKRSLTGAGVFLLGAGVATVLSLLPYALRGGQFMGYLNGAWLFFLKGNVGVITGGLLHRVSGFLTHFFVPEMFFLASSVLLLCVFFKKIKQSGLLFATPLLVWVISDFLSYNLEGTYFPHHLKLLVLSWSIAFGVVVDFFLRRASSEASVPALTSKVDSVKKEEREGLHGAFVVVALIVFFVCFQNTYYGTARAFLKGSVRHDFRDTGLLVERMTQQGDTIYVYGLHTGPIYYYALRNSPSRYFETQQLGMEGALQELQRKLTEKRPKIIVVPLEEEVPPWLSAFLEQGYREEPPQFGYMFFKDTR
ncbi:MAG: glycosyltransferase family 39 protein [bacterium]|nr:glycosyltransferase family 39 protein [bacterium]